MVSKKWPIVFSKKTGRLIDLIEKCGETDGKDQEKLKSEKDALEIWKICLDFQIKD